MRGYADDSWVVAERGGHVGIGNLGFQWPWKTYRQILREAKQRAVEGLFFNEERARDERAEGIG
jgi:hypothetical protein